jgi:glycosyltransferase involved in cell wall biosynthesis
MSDPRVSVIVPVRDRATLLAGALDGLARQTFDDFEVVVIDDGSTDGSGDVARSFADRMRVNVVRTDGVGAVDARRSGIREARGDILAFTDSDCVPEEIWLEHGVNAIDKGADVVQGRTIPQRRVGPLERSISHGGREGLYATCNVFYRREAYDAVGGFDRDAQHRLGFRAGRDGRALGFGEDTLLAWRVAREGRAAFVPECIVRHAVVEPPVGELVWRSWMAGGFPALVREIPELRSTLLRHGVFLGYRRLPVYGLGAAALTRSKWLTAGAAAYWALSRVRDGVKRDGPLGRKMVAVPVEMAVDVVTAASLLWGSARSRSIVL